VGLDVRVDEVLRVIAVDSGSEWWKEWTGRVHKSAAPLEVTHDQVQIRYRNSTGCELFKMPSDIRLANLKSCNHETQGNLEDGR
jgi:hypothetical protein